MRDIFKLGFEGVPDAQIARQLNIERITTGKGNPWTRRAVQDLLTRPFYAGRIAYDGETFAGKHESLIDPADYDRLIAARGDRDLGRGRHTVGRPAKRQALQRLAVCGECGRRWTASRRATGARTATGSAATVPRLLRGEPLLLGAARRLRPPSTRPCSPPRWAAARLPHLDRADQRAPLGGARRLGRSATAVSPTATTRLGARASARRSGPSIWTPTRRRPRSCCRW